MRFVFLLLLATCVRADPPGSLELVVHIEGFRNAIGNAGAALYSSAKGFPRQDQFADQKLPGKIEDDRATIVFQGLRAGTYAVAAIHDANSNAKFDSGLLGIPKEAFGFSNNPVVRFKPPSFAESSFELSAPRTEITIRLRYP